MSESKKFFWNYKNKCYDIVDEEFTDETAVWYIPHTRFSNTMYRIFRENNFSISESMFKTLSLFLKKEEN